MNFKSDFLTNNFRPISVNKFVELYEKNNPDIDKDELRKNLNYFKKLKSQGQKCNCGNPIWIIGSAVSGLGCFICITGDSDNSNDYEIT